MTYILHDFIYQKTRNSRKTIYIHAYMYTYVCIRKHMYIHISKGPSRMYIVSGLAVPKKQLALAPGPSSSAPGGASSFGFRESALAIWRCVCVCMYVYIYIFIFTYMCAYVPYVYK